MFVVFFSVFLVFLVNLHLRGRIVPFERATRVVASFLPLATCVLVWHRFPPWALSVPIDQNRGGIFRTKLAGIVFHFVLEPIRRMPPPIRVGKNEGVLARGSQEAEGALYDNF